MKIGALYQNVLAWAALPGELASVTQTLARGGSLAEVRSTLATSNEAANAILSANVAAGVLPSEITGADVQIAIGQSELLSGIGLTTLLGEIADNVPRGVAAQVNVSGDVAQVTPATLQNTPSSPLFYSLGINNALIAKEPESVSFNFFYTKEVNALLGSAIVSGFDPTTDILQISRQEATGLSDLTLTPLNAPPGPGTLIGAGNTTITLQNVAPDAGAVVICVEIG